MLADIKEDKCQTSKQHPTISWVNLFCSDDLIKKTHFLTYHDVMFPSSSFFFSHQRKEGKSIQVWVVILMTRSSLTFKLHLTVNFRGTDASARAQADADFSARRLSNHLENTGNARCFHFQLAF